MSNRWFEDVCEWSVCGGSLWVEHGVVGGEVEVIVFGKEGP